MASKALVDGEDFYFLYLARISAPNFALVSINIENPSSGTFNAESVHFIDHGLSSTATYNVRMGY